MPYDVSPCIRPVSVHEVGLAVGEAVGLAVGLEVFTRGFGLRVFGAFGDLVFLHCLSHPFMHPG